MKFLHTSDWHVGRTIRNRSRIEEHRAVFAEIIEMAKGEQVDAVLVTGDIFHERRPSLEAQELVAETLAKLARDHIPSVVIPGNHDDPILLRALKPFGDLVQVHIVAEVSENIDSWIVPLTARDGRDKALIGCVPYLHPHQVLTAAAGAGTSEDARLALYQSAVQQSFEVLQKRLKRTSAQAVCIVLAHAHISECEFGGGEWRSSVFPISAGFLPDEMHYIALGHMHKPQAVAGAKTQAWYAGSILQMDFGEREQEKSVCLIDARPGKPATVSTLPLSKGRRLLRRSGTAEEILPQAGDFVDAWVEVILQTDKRTLEMVDQVRALPGVIAVRFAEPQGAVERPSNGRIPQHDRPATELFSDYYKAKRKTDPDPALIALFARLYQEASTAGDEV